jgi:hypothetical protein
MARIAIIQANAAISTALQPGLTAESREAVLIEGPGDLVVQRIPALPDPAPRDLLLGAWGDGLEVARGVRATSLLGQASMGLLSAAHWWLEQHAGDLALLHCRVLD